MTKKLKILHIVGARPNFMKVAPVMREMSKYSEIFEQILVHTGQHYDDNMSKVFFKELDLPTPDINLEVGSGSHACQTAQVMLRFEPVLAEKKPDWIFVYGDVNSTLACALVAVKLGIKVAHVEAGLRSFDRTMPEEYNRLVTDHISDLLFTHCEDANKNLLKEGISAEKIQFVGNVMIDTLVRLVPKAKEQGDFQIKKLKLDKYVLVTLHRPSNVDDSASLAEIMSAIHSVSHTIPVVFPVHPRTRERLSQMKMKFSNNGSLQLVEPMGYLEFLGLETQAKMVITDSGGIQEESSYLGIPCITVRPNTERPVTITHGTNRLVENDRKALMNAVCKVLNNGNVRNNCIPPLWDGKASKRIADVMLTKQPTSKIAN